MTWDSAFVDEAASLLLEGHFQLDVAAHMSKRMGIEVSRAALMNAVLRARPEVTRLCTERRETARNKLADAICADYGAGLYFKEIMAKHNVRGDVIKYVASVRPEAVEQRRRVTAGRTGCKAENFIVRDILGKRKALECFDIPPDPLTEAGKVLIDLERCDCRWPIGRDSAGLQRFCAEAVEPEVSYCSEHYKRSDNKFGSVDQDIKTADYLFWRDTGYVQAEPPTQEQRDEVIRVQLGGEDVDCRGYGRSAFVGSAGTGEGDETASARL